MHIVITRKGDLVCATWSGLEKTEKDTYESGYGITLDEAVRSLFVETPHIATIGAYSHRLKK
jgi:hypothetical protein